MAQSGKQQDATCPTCGGSLAKTPAGQSVLQKVSKSMAQKKGAAPQGAGDPRVAALRQMMMQRMQGGGR